MCMILFSSELTHVNFKLIEVLDGDFRVDTILESIRLSIHSLELPLGLLFELIESLNRCIQILFVNIRHYSSLIVCKLWSDILLELLLNHVDIILIILNCKLLIYLLHSMLHIHTLLYVVLLSHIALELIQHVPQWIPGRELLQAVVKFCLIDLKLWKWDIFI